VTLGPAKPTPDLPARAGQTSVPERMQASNRQRADSTGNASPNMATLRKGVKRGDQRASRAANMSTVIAVKAQMTLVLPGKKKVSKMFAVVSSSLAKDSGKVELYEKEKDVKKTMPLATIRTKNITGISRRTIKKQDCLLVTDTNAATQPYTFVCTNAAVFGQLLDFLNTHTRADGSTGKEQGLKL